MLDDLAENMYMNEKRVMLGYYTRHNHPKNIRDICMVILKGAAEPKRYLMIYMMIF